MSLSSPKPKNFSHRVANPANLRWKYILDSLIEDKRMTDRKLIDQLKECIDSLGKYPLVLEEVTHCAILIGFNANIINLMKPDSLYNHGMRPLVYSDKEHLRTGRGWVRGGNDICYYQNSMKRKNPGYYYTLTWSIVFEHD